MLEHMLAEHGLMHLRALLGFTDFAPEEHAALPPVLQPLVNTHPRTGRRSIYVASHVVGMGVADGRLLLMELIEPATRAGTTVPSRMAGRRPGAVGQPADDASRAPFDERFPRDMRRVTTSDGTEPVGGMGW